jgi:hypothetical protein
MCAWNSKVCVSRSIVEKNILVLLLKDAPVTDLKISEF